jgi:hypothetical protein
LLSFPTTLFAPSHPLSHPAFTSPSTLPQPVTTLLLSPMYSPPVDQPTTPTYTTSTPWNPWHKHATLQQ